MADQVKLTPKQEAFVREYLVDLNATQAAIRAGYKQGTAHVTGCENLRKPKVAERIQELMDERSEKTEITADFVLETIRDTIVTAQRDEQHQHVLKGCELLGKHLKLFTDKTEVTGKDGEQLMPTTIQLVAPKGSGSK